MPLLRLLVYSLNCYVRDLSERTKVFLFGQSALLKGFVTSRGDFFSSPQLPRNAKNYIMLGVTSSLMSCAAMTYGNYLQNRVAIYNWIKIEKFPKDPKILSPSSPIEACRSAKLLCPILPILPKSPSSPFPYWESTESTSHLRCHGRLICSM